MEKETVIYFKIKDWKGVKFPKLNYYLDYKMDEHNSLRNDRKLKIIRYSDICKCLYGKQYEILEQCSLALTNMQRIPQIGEKIKLPGDLLFGGERHFGYRKIETLEEFKSNVFPELDGEKPMEYRQRLYDIIMSYGEHPRRTLKVNSQFKSLIQEFQWEMNLCFTVADLETDISSTFDFDYNNPGELKRIKIILTLEVFEGVK